MPSGTQYASRATSRHHSERATTCSKPNQSAYFRGPPTWRGNPSPNRRPASTSVTNASIVCSERASFVRRSAGIWGIVRCTPVPSLQIHLQRTFPREKRCPKCVRPSTVVKRIINATGIVPAGTHNYSAARDHLATWIISRPSPVASDAKHWDLCLRRGEMTSSGAIDHIGRSRARFQRATCGSRASGSERALSFAGEGIRRVTRPRCAGRLARSGCGSVPQPLRCL